MLASILWIVFIVILVAWLVGWLVIHIGGGLIHLLLIVAVILLLYNLFTNYRARA